MRTGHYTHPYEGESTTRNLRKINPEAARTAVLEYLKTGPLSCRLAEYLVLPGL